MITIQITVDSDLLKHVDNVVETLRSSRSAFVRESLQEKLERLQVAQLETRHREGYRKRPARRGEFTSWEDEQAWGEG